MRNVAQHFDVYAAKSNGNNRAKRRIARYAEYQFYARRRHRLHRDAVDTRRSIVPCYRLKYVEIRGLHALGAIQSQLHAPRFCLVRDIRRFDFQYHRESKFDSVSDCFFFTACKRPAETVESVGRQYFAAGTFAYDAFLVTRQQFCGALAVGPCGPSAAS